MAPQTLGAAADADFALAVDRALSPEERQQVLNRFCALNPHWQGAHVADVLATLTDHDSHLDLIELLHEEHGTEVPEAGLLTAAALACVYRDGREAVTWKTVRALIVRVRGQMPEAGLLTGKRLSHRTGGDKAAVSTNSTEAKLDSQRRAYRPGEQWQYRSVNTDGRWEDMPAAAEPGWFFDSEYRRKSVSTDKDPA